MTQEEKQLLLKDLCARLPYGVKVRRIVYTTSKDTIESVEVFNPDWLKEFYVEDVEFKPYLRTMSSMTEKERDEYRKAYEKDFAILEGSLSAPITYTYPDGTVLRDRPIFNEIDWLNANHFDYHGLIPMGLALEAPEGMYNKEESEKGSEIPIPKTVDEAISTLEKILSDEDREYLLKNGAISMHDSLGRWIRNEWGLWTGSELKNELEKKGFEHPDDMSNYIIEEFIEYCFENLN